MKDILGKAATILLALVVGFGAVTLVNAAPASAASASVTTGDDWQVKTGKGWLQVRTDDGPRWKVLKNGKVIANWKHKGLSWWEQGGNVVRNTFIDVDVKRGDIVSLQRDGEPVYVVKIKRTTVKRLV